MKSTDIFFKLLFVIMILSLHTSSQEVLIDGELRPRSEYRQGFKRPIPDSLSPAFVTIQRSRVNADCKSDVFNSRITLQDARIWGDGNRRVNSSKIELYEGWFEWFSHPSLSIKMGRQTIRYDDQRLIAAPNWSNTGMVHDIMLLKYMQKSLSVHAGLAYNNSKDTTIHTDYIYTNKQNYKALGYIDYYTGIDYKISKKLRAECVFHLFSFAEDFVYQNSVSEKYLGSELDVLLNYNASKEVSVQFGVSKYFNSSSTDQYFKVVDLALHPQHWAYLMFTVKPQFYKSKI